MTLRIAIDDDERDVYAYTLPSTERHFRGAWEWPTDGTSVIQVNIADAPYHSKGLCSSRTCRTVSN